MGLGLRLNTTQQQRSNMDGPRDDHIKPDRERQILYLLTRGT